MGETPVVQLTEPEILTNSREAWDVNNPYGCRAEWGHLIVFTSTSLGILNLAGNSLTGALPAEWGHLSKLERLDLSRRTTCGAALPAEWGWLDHLMELALSHNSLAGPLPQSLTGLKALEQFYFDNTELCAPEASDTISNGDRAFQDWLLDRGIDDVRGASCPPDATDEEPEQPDRAAVSSTERSVCRLAKTRFRSTLRRRPSWQRCGPSYKATSAS